MTIPTIIFIINENMPSISWYPLLALNFPYREQIFADIRNSKPFKVASLSPGKNGDSFESR